MGDQVEVCDQVGHQVEELHWISGIMLDQRSSKFIGFGEHGKGLGCSDMSIDARLKGVPYRTMVCTYFVVEMEGTDVAPSFRFSFRLGFDSECSPYPGIYIYFKFRCRFQTI